MEFQPLQIIQVVNYRESLLRDVTIGHLRQGAEDENYWYFYPSADCVLSAGSCRRICEKLAELNAIIRSKEMLIAAKS